MLEQADRYKVYSKLANYSFIGPPTNFITDLRMLRKDPKYVDFIERKEMQYPILIPQKLGFEPKWLRDFENHLDFIE